MGTSQTCRRNSPQSQRSIRETDPGRKSCSWKTGRDRTSRWDRASVSGQETRHGTRLDHRSANASVNEESATTNTPVFFWIMEEIMNSSHSTNKGPARADPNYCKVQR